MVTPGEAAFPHPPPVLVAARAGEAGANAPASTTAARSGRIRVRMRDIFGRPGQGNVKPGCRVVGNLRLDKG